MAKLLLVDDNKAVVDLMLEILSDEGHEVVISRNGKQAIELLEKDKNFDIIISDILMPVMDGFDLVKYLSGIDKIPLIVMSGGGISISSSSALKAMEGDADVLLRKPVNIEQLNEAIASLL